ncbi:hypothetical protein [Candidatus Laterigemmans baculatus]|uniref:hypothetical protein n=1 Tax=Candidatus Laterigemmans baculatus TaxID=2770505 RepID=UPI0013D9F589|nr:hypothetical protein [Candidatus Laterigemmans baculatus]
MRLLRSSTRFLLRAAAYIWASPYTVAGLALGLACGGRWRLVRGVVEIHGPGVRWVLEHLPVSAAAMTIGHTVLGRDPGALDRTRAHERVHVRQFERWGLLMGPAYVAASAYAYARGRHFYRDNPFEVEAYAADRRREREHSSAAGR